ncbi:CASP8 and FADD-like apoptosis regulator a isoform X2 [Paramormyrops kingsleyae]|uniref:CASP8 and FADD-like apoptosis regulator a isoform X2 n=1 Tax=Paramormyrops kingsleyae TaxID=1676925 RepID=UPI003B96D34D
MSILWAAPDLHHGHQGKCLRFTSLVRPESKYGLSYRSSETCTFNLLGPAMTDEQCQTINRVVEELNHEERRKLAYLCGDLEPEGCVEDLRGKLSSLTLDVRVGPLILLELMLKMGRFDILKRILGRNRQEVEVLLENGCVVSDYRLLMADLSENLGKEDLRSLIFLLSEILPKGRQETATSFLDVVVELEKLNKVSSEKLELIEQCLRNIRRADLAKKVQRYQMKVFPQIKFSELGLPNGPTERDIFTFACSGTQHVRMSSPRVEPSPGIARCQMVQSSATKLHAPCLQPIRANAPENVKMSVPETGRQYCQDPLQTYRMQANPRGVCVIIDCVGHDGDMLEQAFERLHFSTIQHKWPNVAESRSILRMVSQRHRELQESDAFVCCILSRGQGNSLLATEETGPGLSLDAVQRSFSTEACPGLAGKPKLFFIQSYTVDAGAPAFQQHHDDDLETDGPSVSAYMESVPSGADVFWSHCSTEHRQLEEGTHSSVYLRTLCAALLNGQKRKRHLLDIHTEVNSVIYEYNRCNVGKAYSLSLRHTLRKALFLP